MRQEDYLNPGVQGQLGQYNKTQIQKEKKK
jgi:hypothetical protein